MSGDVFEPQKQALKINYSPYYFNFVTGIWSCRGPNVSRRDVSTLSADVLQRGRLGLHLQTFSHRPVQTCVSMAMYTL